MATLIPFRVLPRHTLPLLLASVALIAAACGGSDAAAPTTANPPVAADSGADESRANGDAAQETAAAQGSTEQDALPADNAGPENDDSADGDPANEDAGDESSGDAPANEPSDETDPPQDADPSVSLGAPSPFDRDNALRILETLTVTIGERVQGTQGERDAAAFLAAEFESAGYAVELQAVPLESRRVEELRLRVDGREIDAAAFDGTPAGDVGGRLVIVPGLGAEADFARIDARGAIVLIERGVLFFRDKIANAEAAGAAGVIIYNNEPGIFSGTLGDPAGIAAIAISQADGLDLAAQAARADLRTEILIRFDELSGQSQNVVARNPDGVCRVWVGGHYDTVPGVSGANDNGSGSALVVELARAYAGSAAGRQVCFVGFGAEEAVDSSPGILGSRVFVQGLTESGEIADVRAMLNLDVAASGSTLILIGDGALVDQANDVAEALSIRAQAGTLPAGSGSDHLNFAQLGVPVIFPTLLGGPIHTPADNFGAVQPERLAAIGELAHGILGCLAAEADPAQATAAACPVGVGN